MSLSPFDTFQSRFVTYLLNRPRKLQNISFVMIFPCITQQEDKFNYTISLLTCLADSWVNADHAFVTIDL